MLQNAKLVYIYYIQAIYSKIVVEECLATLKFYLKKMNLHVYTTLCDKQILKLSHKFTFTIVYIIFQSVKPACFNI